MINTPASSLDQIEPSSSSFPRITELLSGKAMPRPSTYAPVSSPSSPSSFTEELPALSKETSTSKNELPELPPLPSLGTIKENVATAMDELPVAMPAPVIKPVAEKPVFTEPVPAPVPEEPVLSASAPVFDPPIIKNEPIEPTPTEPAPVSDPFVAAPSPFEKGPEKVPPAFSDYQETLPGFEDIEKTASDAQLVEALLPVVESSLEKALYAPKTGLHMYLEPMLRATVRRAIAEQMQTMHHFGQISLIDRIAWRFKALFTSRTYDDIVFERTHRYRVEEVYLLRYQSNSLISYASHDPSRHSTPRKIKYDLSRLVEELTDDEGELRKSFELPNKNTAVVRCGQNCFLLASIRGPINALVRADLDYVLSQVEQRFGERLRDQGQHFVHVLQPLLEGCLLIQSPPPPH